MSLQSGYIGAIGSSLFTNSSIPQHSLGTKVTDGAGREFRYVKAGGDIAAGKLVGTYTENATEHSLAPQAAAAIGATSVSITTGGTIVANAYEGGYLVVTNTPGMGLAYEIDHHAGRTGTGTLVFYLKDPIKVALTTAASKIDLVANPYGAVTTWVDGSGTETGVPVGVTTYALTSGYYGWVCVHGVVSCLADGTLTIGHGVVASDATDGAVEVATAASTEALCPVGYALTSGTTTEYPAIFLTIG